MKDLHLLPKFRDGWSYLYVEHCKIDQEDKAVAIHDANGKVPVPCAALALMMLGPGVSITHAAVTTLADNGCLVAWCGEQGVRFYALGLGETRDARNLLRQARLWADSTRHLEVVFRMYRIRFAEPVPEGLTLQQLRGREGIRVREAYAHASKETGVAWSGREFRRGSWGDTDPVNRALSVANSCLYGIVHAGIVSAGFSPALGFIHTGKMLSFVYDIADLYKAELTIPLAFRETAQSVEGIDRRVRLACRDAFCGGKLLMRIVPDIYRVLAVGERQDAEVDDPYASDEGRPGGLWDPKNGDVPGGVNHSEPDGVPHGGDDPRTGPDDTSRGPDALDA